MPNNSYIAVRPDKQFITVDDRATAAEFIAEGGMLYLIIHYWHRSDALPEGGEWLPQSHLVKEVGSR